MKSAVRNHKVETSSKTGCEKWGWERENRRGRGEKGKGEGKKKDKGVMNGGREMERWMNKGNRRREMRRMEKGKEEQQIREKKV